MSLESWPSRRIVWDFRHGDAATILQNFGRYLSWLAPDNLRDMTCKKRGVLHTTNWLHRCDMGGMGAGRSSREAVIGQGGYILIGCLIEADPGVIVSRWTNWRGGKRGLLLEKIAQIENQSQ